MPVFSDRFTVKTNRLTLESIIFFSSETVREVSTRATRRKADEVNGSSERVVRTANNK